MKQYYPLWRTTKGEQAGNLMLFKASACPTESMARIVQQLAAPILRARFGMEPEGIKMIEHTREESGALVSEYFPHRFALTPLGPAAVLEGPAILGKGAPLRDTPSPEGHTMTPEDEAAFLAQFDPETGKRRTVH